MEFPSLIELIINPVTLGIIALYLILIFWELISPARKLPHVNYWPFKGIAAFSVYFIISSYMPYLTDSWLSQFQLFDLSHLSIWTGALIGFMSYQIIGYAWHRVIHRSNFLWKIFHQMHHSPERLDAFSAFYFSPFDMIGWSVITSISLILVGISPEAAMITVLVLTFFGLFTHANIKTPHWLGYIIQRPESHAIHHERGVHGFNFTELPLIDMLGGTFKNPKSRKLRTGFYNGGSSRVLEMLQFKDVSKPRDNFS